MAGPDALGVLGPLAGSDQLGQAVVADLDDPFLHEQVGRLQITMHDAVIVQVSNAVDQPLEPVANLGLAASRAGYCFKTLARLGPATYSMTTNVSPASLVLRSKIVSKFGHFRFMQCTTPRRSTSRLRRISLSATSLPESEVA